VSGVRASYRFGVLWIAENDEPEDLDPENVSAYISTLLLADLFGKEPLAVARAVVRRRKAALAQERYERQAPRSA
jgi:hypothetical protein